MRLASLPMYDLDEARPATDALWQALRNAFLREGLEDAPERLTRNTPVVSQWASPRLFFSQCCGYDLVFGFSSALELLAMPRYAAETGCSAYDYRSCVILREDSKAADLDDLRGSICAVNGFNSYSGTGALRALVAPLSRQGRFFGAVRVSGGHAQSAELVRSGEADVASIDCVTAAAAAPTAGAGRTARAPPDGSRPGAALCHQPGIATRYDQADARGAYGGVGPPAAAELLRRPVH